jgi:hypothetical protein
VFHDVHICFLSFPLHFHQITFNPHFMFFLQEAQNEDLENIPDSIVVPFAAVQGAFREEEITSDNSEFDKVYLSENVSLFHHIHCNCHISFDFEFRK